MDEMDKGFKAACLYYCNYFQITNAKVAFSIGPEFGEFPKFLPGFKHCCEDKFNNTPGCNLIQLNKEEFISHTDLKYYLFIRPSIDSCSCMEYSLTTDEFDIERLKQQEMQMEEEKKQEDYNPLKYQ